jgi:ABC-2 type transport system permease protein
MDLSPAAKEKLNKYISQGGNMVISGEPGKQQIVNPLLSHTGVQLMNGQLVQPSFDETPDKVWAYLTPTSYDLSEEYYFRLFKHLWAHKAYGDSLKAPFAGMTALSYTSDSSFAIKPLVETMPGKSWLKAGRLVTDSTPPVFSPQDGDIEAISFPAAVQLTRQLKGKEQRIIICGDADWGSNLRLIDDWARSVYSWVSYNETPVYTPIPYATDNKLMLSPAGAGIQKIVYPWVLPGLTLLVGAVLLIRRKRK